ncbi:hypothetical protein P7K49_039618 [Saguinus oedipus]|uniref:Uncharacterized protein n=1 Tax=Saguinus oedipus TaxID=9490 RepID=A0ABQ9TBF0_SAGOE|nr:hypothetical protein P7K49_039618 [Saguinus oedipus]
MEGRIPLRQQLQHIRQAQNHQGMKYSQEVQLCSDIEVPVQCVQNSQLHAQQLICGIVRAIELYKVVYLWNCLIFFIKFCSKLQGNNCGTMQIFLFYLCQNQEGVEDGEGRVKSELGEVQVVLKLQKPLHNFLKGIADFILLGFATMPQVRLVVLGQLQVAEQLVPVQDAFQVVQFEKL